MGRRNDGKRGLAHREGIRQEHREASWNRSNFFWGTFQYKPPNAALAASSEFDQQSMIALA